MIEVREGDWAINKDTFGRFDIRHVTKVTPKTVSGKFYPNGRDCRVDRSTVMFSGEEVRARSVLERLTSSRAQMSDEIQGATRRHLARVEAIISK
jgi:hypothetical protein